MSTNKTEIRKDFFTSATPMTFSQVKNFLENVVLARHKAGKKVPPVILWGAPGVGKSCLIEEVFGGTDKGVKTVILSQIGALDANGLPYIKNEKRINSNGDEEIHEVCEFSNTNTFGRGRNHLFLDELNNSAPSTTAMVQNLLSSYKLGGDDYSNVCIVAACNPPSTNSLAMDLNHPIMSRCLHIRFDYGVEDFVNYAMETASIHPAIVAFHKKTGGQYLQANWDFLKHSGASYQVAEPSQNEPYPCPRSWSLASDFMMTLQEAAKGGGVVDYSMLKPLVEGCVGIVAAQQFATTYAYMTKIPDIEMIYKGKLTADKFKHDKEIAVEYITMVSIINFIAGQVDRAKVDGVACKIDAKSKNKNENPAYNLVAGTHRCLEFIASMASPELAVTTLTAISSKYRSVLSGTFLNTLYSGVDPDAGLTRESLIKFSNKTAVGSVDMNNKVG